MTDQPTPGEPLLSDEQYEAIIQAYFGCELLSTERGEELRFMHRDKCLRWLKKLHSDSARSMEFAEAYGLHFRDGARYMALLLTAKIASGELRVVKKAKIGNAKSPLVCSQCELYLGNLQGPNFCPGCGSLIA